MIIISQCFVYLQVLSPIHHGIETFSLTLHTVNKSCVMRTRPNNALLVDDLLCLYYLYYITQ